jgi:ribose 5-phosphate isomerase B
MFYIVADHTGFELKQGIIRQLQSSEIEDANPVYDQLDDYPQVAHKLVEVLSQHPQAMGIAICGTGQGICMAVNKHPGMRAGITTYTHVVAKLREHNQANVLCFPATLELQTALQLIEVFAQTPVSIEARHARRVEQLSLLDKGLLLS